MRFILTTVAAALISIGLTACSNADTPAKDTAMTATTPASGEATGITERNANNRLKETLSTNLKAAGINAKVTNIRPTEINSLYWVSLDGLPSVYTTSDGKYIIQGDVIRLDKNTVHNVSDSLQSGDSKALLAKVNIKDTITFKPNGNTRAVVYVFTDASCPYCHKLHEEMDSITAKGIEVRYLAWPRAQQFVPVMNAIWCSENRAAAFGSAIKNLPVTAPQCQSPIMGQHALGQQIGVNGTPAIYSTDGKYLGGYMTADEIARKLGL